MMTGTAFWQQKKELPFIFSVTVGSGQSFRLPTVASGTYNCVIDWGDENSGTLDNSLGPDRTHTYIVGGVYDIRISGVFDGWSTNNYPDRLKITQVKQWGVMKPGTGYGAFFGCSNLIVTASDILDTSACKTLQVFWGSCSSLTDVPNMELWDISNVTTLYRCFLNCYLFNQDLNGWDTSSVTIFYSIFLGCWVFNGNISDWNLTNAYTTAEMFTRCYAFNQDISGWDVSSVVIFGGYATPANDGARGMFSQCTSFNQDISGWDTSSATSMRNMFKDAESFDQDISGWNFSSVNDFRMFLTAATLSTSNYDSLLIVLESQSSQSNISFAGGNSKYTAGSAAATARAALISDHSWTIADGGSI